MRQMSLDQIWKAFEEELNRTLDQLVPARKQKKNAKPARPWYNSRLLEQRRIVRTRENKYIKYKENHHCHVFTRERNRYNIMLKFNKRASIVELVHSSQNNCKKL